MEKALRDYAMGYFHAVTLQNMEESRGSAYIDGYLVGVEDRDPDASWIKIISPPEIDLPF